MGISEILHSYELWIHFVAGVLIVALALFYLWRFCVGSFVNAVDNSKYSYLIIRWILSRKGTEMSPEMEKKFINVNDMNTIINMQNFIDSIKIVTTEKKKYKDLKHPFFVWHGHVFCRTNGNDIVKIDDAKLGKIEENETVDEIVISGNFSKVMTAVHFAVEMEKHFKDVN